MSSTGSTTTTAAASLAHSPRLVARVLRPFQEFAHTESAGGIVLLACTALALAWVNSPWGESYHHVWETPVAVRLGGLALDMTLHHFINDGLMAVFFFLVGLEIKRELLVGELASLKQAALPIAGALGGMLVPAALYALFNVGRPGAPGWGIPMATDIAFALGVLALLGPRVPVALKIFLTALAIVDDIGAVLVIAVFYTADIAWPMLGWAGVILALLLVAGRAHVRHPAVYLIPGVAVWALFLASGVHATVAGVLLAMTIPARTLIDEDEFIERAGGALDEFRNASGPEVTVMNNREQQEALRALEHATDEAQAPLMKMEHKLHGVVAFGIMPLFALANAGVPLGGEMVSGVAWSVTLGVVVGLVLGKPLGITLFAWLAVRLGAAALPAGAGWRALHGVSWLGGIGFTMSLFVAGLAFGDAALLDSAKLGILAASLVAGAAGAVLLLRGGGAPSRIGGAPPEPQNLPRTVAVFDPSSNGQGGVSASSASIHSAIPIARIVSWPPPPEQQ
jgi:Na+:H+ antiporter, NhaA family